MPPPRPNHNRAQFNVYLSDEDHAMIHHIRTQLGLDTEAATLRAIIRRAAADAGYKPAPASNKKTPRKKSRA